MNEKDGYDPAILLSGFCYDGFQFAAAGGVSFCATLPETNIAPCKWMVGILLSFWDGLLSGAMLVSGSVFIFLFLLLSGGTWVAL